MYFTVDRFEHGAAVLIADDDTQLLLPAEAANSLGVREGDVLSLYPDAIETARRKQNAAAKLQSLFSHATGAEDPSDPPAFTD